MLIASSGQNHTHYTLGRDRPFDPTLAQKIPARYLLQQLEGGFPPRFSSDDDGVQILTEQVAMSKSCFKTYKHSADLRCFAKMLPQAEIATSFSASGELSSPRSLSITAQAHH